MMKSKAGSSERRRQEKNEMDSGKRKNDSEHRMRNAPSVTMFNTNSPRAEPKESKKGRTVVSRPP